MADELPWLSLTEAAAVSGLARETVRARARRGLIPSRKGNDGKVLVQVPSGVMSTHVQDESELVADLSAEVAELREALTRAESDRDTAKAVAMAEVAAATSAAKATVDAKDELIAELKALLAEARQPWWRRWW